MFDFSLIIFVNVSIDLMIVFFHERLARIIPQSPKRLHNIYTTQTRDLIRTCSYFQRNFVCSNHSTEVRKVAHQLFKRFKPKCVVPLCRSQPRFHISILNVQWTQRLRLRFAVETKWTSHDDAKVKEIFGKVKSEFLKALNSPNGYYLGLTSNPAIRAETHGRDGRSKFIIYHIAKNLNEAQKMEGISICHFAFNENHRAALLNKKVGSRR